MSYNNVNRIEENPSVEGDSQGGGGGDSGRRRRDNNKKVTNGDSRHERGTTPGVTTRAKARKENLVE